jgi:hypothetical protein
MKIRIKLANTKRAHLLSPVNPWFHLDDYVDELRQAAIWSKE